VTSSILFLKIFISSGKKGFSVKKINFLKFCFMGFLGLIFASFNIHAEDKKGDENLNELVAKFKNEYVTTVDNKLFFYAKPSGLEWVGTSLMAGIFSGYSIGLLIESKAKKKDKVAKYIVATILAVPAAYFISRLFKDIHMKIDKNVLYISFDEIGIYKWGKLKVKWVEFDEIYIKKNKFDGGNSIRTASYCNRKLKSFWDISDNDRYLPISFDDFIDISLYYLAKYDPKK
jgi:hypothetical protein